MLRVQTILWENERKMMNCPRDPLAGQGVRLHMMKKLIGTLLITLVPWSQSFGSELPFTNAVKASLVFEEESNPAEHYPHVLLVYLHLENVHDSDVNWECDSINGVEAILLDSKGNAVPHPPSNASVISGPKTYLLPYRSRLDWLISHGGISMMGNLKENVALIVGGTGWLIPRSSLSSYSLKLRVTGSPWARSVPRGGKQKPAILFDIPGTRIVIQ
jgi:hypothetical protein